MASDKPAGYQFSCACGQSLTVAPVTGPGKQTTSKLAMLAVLLSTGFFMPGISLAAVVIGIVAAARIRSNSQLAGGSLAGLAIVLGLAGSAFSLVTAWWLWGFSELGPS